VLRVAGRAPGSAGSRRSDVSPVDAEPTGGTPALPIKILACPWTHLLPGRCRRHRSLGFVDTINRARGTKSPRPSSGGMRGAGARRGDFEAIVPVQPVGTWQQSYSWSGRPLSASVFRLTKRARAPGSRGQSCGFFEPFSAGQQTARGADWAVPLPSTVGARFGGIPEQQAGLEHIPPSRSELA